MRRSMVPSLSKKKEEKTESRRPETKTGSAAPMSAKTTDWVPAGSEPRCEKVNPPLGSLTQIWKDFFPAPSSQTRKISAEIGQECR